MLKFLSIGFILFLTACGQNMQVAESTSSASLAESSNEIILGDLIMTEEEYNNMFSEEENDLGVSQAAKHKNSQKWPNGLLPIDFANGISKKKQDLFFKYCAMWGEGTGVECVRKTYHRAHVYVSEKVAVKGGCTAQFGYKRNSRRTITLPYSGCWSQRVILHELGHVLGLMHEHQKPDRDRHLRVKWSNIKSHVKYAFDKLPARNKTYNFDFDSIMMYSSKAFSKNGRPTMVKYNNQQSLWTAKHKLSSSDKKFMASLYPTRSKASTPTHPRNPVNPKCSGIVRGGSICYEIP